MTNWEEVLIQLAVITILGGLIVGLVISGVNHWSDEQKRAELNVNDSAIYFCVVWDENNENYRVDLRYDLNVVTRRHAVNVYKIDVNFPDETSSRMTHPPFTHDNFNWEIMPDYDDSIPLYDHQTFLEPKMKRCIITIYYEDYKGFREPINCYYALNITQEYKSENLYSPTSWTQIGAFIGTEGWD